MISTLFALSLKLFAISTTQTHADRVFVVGDESCGCCCSFSGWERTIRGLFWLGLYGDRALNAASRMTRNSSTTNTTPESPKTTEPLSDNVKITKITFTTGIGMVFMMCVVVFWLISFIRL